MTIVTLGIDFAKDVFALHGVNGAGKLELLKPASEAHGTDRRAAVHHRPGTLGAH